MRYCEAAINFLIIMHISFRLRKAFLCFMRLAESRVRSGFDQCENYGAQHDCGSGFNVGTFVSPAGTIALLFLISFIALMLCISTNTSYQYCFTKAQYQCH